jgi:hypothetical protein
MRASPAPRLPVFGLTMIGSPQLHEASDEIKDEHLPRIVRGEVRWCQGYSEPGAGSDLAGLQTRAVPDGDDFVVNGQKIWTSYADRADWMFLLVRTDPAAEKHAGITFLLMDMSSPGVSVRPIRLISGYSPFCETFIHDVRVPRRNVVGKVNGGWPIAKKLLGFERTMIADVFLERDEIGNTDRMLDLARRYVGPAEGPLADSLLRDRITQTKPDRPVSISRCSGTAFRQAASADQSRRSSSTTAPSLNKRRHELFLSVLGPQALGWEGEGFEPREVKRLGDWLRARAQTRSREAPPRFSSTSSLSACSDCRTERNEARTQRGAPAAARARGVRPFQVVAQAHPCAARFRRCGRILP